jgi:hypothetical protein
MIQFPDCFLVMFGALAIGGFFCLSLPPFHEIERGFYKSSAAVFLTSALVIVAGKGVLLARSATPSALSIVELAGWTTFAACGALYLYSLWGNPYRLRARAYLGTLIFGLLALTVSASRFRLAPLASLETVLYPLSFAMSAATLGAAVTGMLLGHWYLIDTGMSLVPLQRVLRAFTISLVGQLAVAAVLLLVLSLSPQPETAVGIDSLWSQHRALLLTRVVLGPLAALVLAALIARTLAIPQTMAATGLFYIAVLAVAVGEMLSRLILLRTSLPV